MADPVIVAEKLARSFKAAQALKGLDLSIEPGEIVGLVGPDGAGKTTALRLMAAVMRPSSGCVRVAGFDSVRQADKIHMHVGYMPQRFSLYGDLSVLENLNFYADLFHVSAHARRERIERLLAFANLGHFTDRHAGRLSGGMQKKLALACTLIHEPWVLLLDEPTTGVDPVSRREFWDLLADVHVGGTTVVVSTPYMDEAERCHRVALLFRGDLIECGTPGALKAGLHGQLVEIYVGAQSQARQAILGSPGVMEVQVYGNALHVFVDDAARRLPELSAALATAGIHVDRARFIQPRMEEAFISLITHKQRINNARQ